MNRHNLKPKQVNLAQAKAILDRARAATPFLSVDCEPCVSVPMDNIDARRIYSLRSAEFRDWLINTCYNEFESVPSDGSLRAALWLLEAQARHGEMPPQKIDYRIGFDGDPYAPSRVFVDLAGDQGQLVEITSGGWKVANSFRHGFRHSNDKLPLPAPIEAANGKPLEEFRDLLSLGKGANWSTIVGWIISAMRPSGPYPILTITGPPGSGKSLLARALRSLIDPSNAALRRLPAQDKELRQFAMHNWILAFDMVDRIGSKVADALVAIASGDTIEIPQADSREPISLQIARPVILVATAGEKTPAWRRRSTLAARMMTVELTQISRPRPEAAIWREIEAIRPAVLAVLCNAVSQALHDIREVDLPMATRFPDSAVWAAAAAPALGLNAQAIIEAFAGRVAKEAGLLL